MRRYRSMSRQTDEDYDPSISGRFYGCLLIPPVFAAGFYETADIIDWIMAALSFIVEIISIIQMTGRLQRYCIFIHHGPYREGNP